VCGIHLVTVEEKCRQLVQDLELGDAVDESLITQVEVGGVLVQRNHGLAKETVQQADAVLRAIRVTGQDSHHGSDNDDEIIYQLGAGP
jgi:uncharacterized protein YaiI (UPF0178 family)